MTEQTVGHQPKHDPIETIPEFIDTFDRFLGMRGYRPSSRQAYLKVAKHFIYWHEARSPAARKINRETIRTFLEEHLPVCRCSKPGYKEIKTVRAALKQMLLMRGDASGPKINDEVPPEIEAAIGHFDEYLRNVCGLSEATRWYHCRHARMFLSWLFGDRPLVFARITPQTLCRFVTAIAADYCPGSIGVFVYSLRTFLKFLQFTGHATPSVAAMIPRPPNWSAARVPQALNRKELSLFLSVFDCTTAIGKRDYAMARCLTDLGLRGYEVANMQLNAIDWHNGELHLTKTKSRREDVLPIPGTMAKALITYLRYGRPATESRAVFVHHRAPTGQAVQTTTVRGAIRRAFSRAGLPWSGPHILCNTVATRLLEGGASLKEIADVLRHRSIDTAKSYTKVDLSHLVHVALPWPGRSS